MLQIIPAIDIIDGKCVRLTKGDYNQKKVYNENPLEVARQFEDAGIKRLHLVDLDGAKAQHVVNHKVLKEIATKTSLEIDFGGGLKSDKDLAIAFDSGAKQITGGSIAVKNRDVFTGWIEKFGSEKIILGADVKGEFIAISGWTETTKIGIDDFIEGYIKEGITYIICTDISKDGALAGTSVNLYKRLVKRFPEAKIIASGGVTHIDEIELLNQTGVFGAIIGKAIYENRISLNDLNRFVV